MLTVYVDGHFVNPSDLTFSSVDPGGFETASFSLTAPLFEVQAGVEVRVMEGMDVAWHGRVEEPGKKLSDAQVVYQVNAVGYGAELKDNPFAMIYVDGDPSNWGAVSLTRKQTLVTGNNSPVSDPSVQVSLDNGLPSMMAALPDTWASPKVPICEGVWDAGFGNVISQAIFEWKVNPTITVSIVAADFNWFLLYFIALDDSFVLTAPIQTGDLITGVGTTSGTVNLLNPSSAGRYLGFQFLYGATPAGNASSTFDTATFNLTVYGPHGLTVRTSGLVATLYTRRGLWLSDIVNDVIKRGKFRYDTNIAENQFLVTQASYRDKTDQESMIEDMRKLTGWHWGVWEPGCLGQSPTFWFTPPPPVATTSVSIRDCDEIDLTESFSTMHDQVVVSYTDSLGIKGFATASGPHPRLTDKPHVLSIDMGVATPDAASAFASYVLVLDQTESRVAGTCQLPSRMADGRWAHMIRPGRDKIQIPDFPASGSRIGDSPSRGDTFRVKRITVGVTNGQPSTTVEFDQGADLIEVLQSRLAQGNSSIGF